MSSVSVYYALLTIYLLSLYDKSIYQKQMSLEKK